MSGNRFTHIVERQGRLEVRIDGLVESVHQLRETVQSLAAQNAKLTLQLERAKAGYAVLAGIVTIAGSLGALITHVWGWTKGQQ